jgi:hypothetical protein
MQPDAGQGIKSVLQMRRLSAERIAPTVRQSREGALIVGQLLGTACAEGFLAETTAE